MYTTWDGKKSRLNFSYLIKGVKNLLHIVHKKAMVALVGANVHQVSLTSAKSKI